MARKWRIGDRVYPIVISDIARVIEDNENFNFDNFVGIIVDEKYGYSVRWLDANRKNKLSLPLKDAWYDDDELTDYKKYFMDCVDDARESLKY